MPVFLEEFGKWRCSSIHSWPRNQMETVGRIRRWLSSSLKLPVRSEDNLYPSQESNSISSCPACSLVSVQTHRKMEERITNSLSLQDMNALRTTYCVLWCEFNLFLYLISRHTCVSHALIHRFCLLVSNPVRVSKQWLLHHYRVTFLE